MKSRYYALLLLVLPGSFPVVAGAAATDSTTAGGVASIRAEADSLARLSHSALTRRFLDATEELPAIAPRTVYYDTSRTHYWTAAERNALPDSLRALLRERTLDQEFYYNTRYGSPLAYLRPLEILAEAGLSDVTGKRIADYGYGTIGHLRLLACMGADLIGIDVDPLLRVLYSDSADTGTIRGSRGRAGSIKLVTGSFPADPSTEEAVGRGLHLFLSKNTLKNGYIHPAEAVNPRMLVHLGVSDSAFVAKIYQLLVPGGRAMIYNLTPAPNRPGTPYKPWADGHCPFSETLLKRAGFKVLAFDRDDSGPARAMGHALGWDRGDGAMNLETDLFATYTLLQKPGP